MNTPITLFRGISFALLLTFCCTVSYASSGNDYVRFVESNLEEAKLRASAEGKMVFVDFYASWCTPCKWMDQTTFRDKKVVDMLNENFISVKMNIDVPEGFEMKNKYDVQFLPTILIFNSQGKIIERIEETLTAKDLTALLEQHNASYNKIISTNAVNSSPSAQRTFEHTQDDSFTMSTSEYNQYRDQQKSVYRVQVGVYRKYAGAAKQVKYLRDTFIESVIVMNDNRGGEVLYKVLLGQFKTYEEAESFRKILERDFDIKAIVS